MMAQTPPIPLLFFCMLCIIVPSSEVVLRKKLAKAVKKEKYVAGFGLGR
jgi:hypothetical protein